MKNQRKAEKNWKFSCAQFVIISHFSSRQKKHISNSPFVGQLSAWSFPRLVLLFQNLRSGEPAHQPVNNKGYCCWLKAVQSELLTLINCTQLKAEIDTTKREKKLKAFVAIQWH